MRKNIILIFILALRSIPLYAQEGPYIQSLDLPNARAAAMGGFHPGLTDDFASAFNNPAGFAAIEPQKAYFELMGEADNVITLYEIFVRKTRGLELLKMITSHMDASAAMGGPVAFGRIEDGLGWRVFNATRLAAIWDREDVFVINPILSEELTGVIGYGLRVSEDSNGTLDLGLSVKGFYRILSVPEMVFVQEVKHIFADMGEKRMATQFGLSFDAGLRWTKNDSFSFAVLAKDFWSPTYIMYFRNLVQFLKYEIYETLSKPIKPQVATGFTVRLKSPIMHRWNTDLIFSLSHNGILEFITRSPRSTLLFLAAGLELRFLEVISVRAGWSDWMPAGGIGINFTGFKIDVSLAGKQQGNKPGEHDTIAANINLQFHY